MCVGIAMIMPRDHAKAGLQSHFTSLVAPVKDAYDRLLIRCNCGHFPIMGLQSYLACSR